MAIRNRRRTTESDLVRQCLDYLALNGVFAWRSNNAGVRRRDRSGREFWHFAGLRGVSDVLGVLPGGRLLAIECKSATGPIRPEQLAFLARVTELGGLAFICRSLDDLIAALRLEDVTSPAP